jgi:hypothetical protein
MLPGGVFVGSEQPALGAEGEGKELNTSQLPTDIASMYAGSNGENEAVELDNEQKLRWEKFLEYGKLGDVELGPDILTTMELTEGEGLDQEVGVGNPSERMALDPLMQLELGKQLMQNLEKDDEVSGFEEMDVMQREVMPTELVRKLELERKEQ